MTLITLLLFVIATGIVYVVHLQRKTIEGQETLIGHFIELVKKEMSVPAPLRGNDMRELISKRQVMSKSS